MFRGRKLIPFLLLTTVATRVDAQASPLSHAPTNNGSINGDSLTWVAGDVPGRARAYLLGEPSKHGLFAARFQYPAGYLLQPHWHTATVHATVLSGRIHVGMGDVVDSTRTVAYGPGSFIVFEGGMHHFEYFSEPTIVHVEGVGPFRTIYVEQRQPRATP